MALPTTIDQVKAEFEAVEDLGPIDAYDERMSLLIKLGKAMEPMPAALQVDENLVRGCASQVWVYPVPTSTADKLHFYAASAADIPRGIIALILMLVQDKSAAEIRSLDIIESLRPLALDTHFSSVRTSGLANMVAKIQETAARLAA